MSRIENLTPYPVSPIEICRGLSFCLGRATELFLNAPWQGGAEDCLKALRYLELEGSGSFSLPCAHEQAFRLNLFGLVAFFQDTPGDMLWKDIAEKSKSFLFHLYNYATNQSKSLSMENMMVTIQGLRNVLALRDTTGQIYEGMTGLPRMEASHE